MLAQSSSSPPSSMWAADFHAAVTAAYLSLKPSMHSIMCQAMMERSPSSHLGSRPSLDTPTAADATADNATLLVHSQSEQVVMAASEGARQKHSTRVGSVRPLGRIKVAWGEAPKLNSVAPLPLPGSGSSSSMQSSSLDAGTSRLQDCSATGKRTTGTAAALDR